MISKLLLFAHFYGYTHILVYFVIACLAFTLATAEYAVRFMSCVMERSNTVTFALTVSSYEVKIFWS